MKNFGKIIDNFDAVTKQYVDDKDALKLDKAGGSITGNLTVGCNLTVNGTTTTVDSTTLQVKDKLIEVAHGNTTTLTTPAGLVAPKYDGTNSGALVFDSTGTAYVGDVTLKDGNIDVANSGLQPLATRTGLVGGNLVQYDSTAQTLKDSGKKISDLATTSQVNTKYTKPSGGIPKTDLASDVQTSLGKADNAMPKSGGTFTGPVSSTSYYKSENTDLRTSTTLSHIAVKVDNGRTNSHTAYMNGQINIKSASSSSEKTITIPDKAGTIALTSDIPSKTSQLTNDSGFTANKGTVTSVSVKMNNTTKGTVTSSGTIDLGTVLTDESKFATSAQGTKADNAMPKSGGTFTGNISVPKTITFTDTTNPYIKMTTGGTDFYFQSTSGQFGLGPTWDKATHWDSNGNVTFPTTPKVGSSSLALKTDLSGKQDKLTAGSNISISGNTISATVPAEAKNGTLTIQRNGTKVATFGANQSTNETANITVPVKVSELTNDSGFTTNKGTVTQVKINGATKSPNSAGLVDLGTDFVKTANLPIKSASLSGTTLYLTL